MDDCAGAGFGGLYQGYLFGPGLGSHSALNEVRRMMYNLSLMTATSGQTDAHTHCGETGCRRRKTGGRERRSGQGAVDEIIEVDDETSQLIGWAR